MQQLRPSSVTRACGRACTCGRPLGPISLQRVMCRPPPVALRGASHSHRTALSSWVAPGAPTPVGDNVVHHAVSVEVRLVEKDSAPAESLRRAHGQRALHLLRVLRHTAYFPHPSRRRQSISGKVRARELRGQQRRELRAAEHPHRQQQHHNLCRPRRGVGAVPTVVGYVQLRRARIRSVRSDSCARAAVWARPLVPSHRGA